MIKNILRKLWLTTPFSVRLKIVRLTQASFTASAAVVIINENGEVLLLDHLLRAGSGWGLPGGFIEHDESPEEGIRREIREETGLEINDLKLLRVRTVSRHIEILFSAGARDKGEIKSREIRDLRWFRYEDLPEKLSGSQKKLIRDCLDAGSK